MTHLPSIDDVALSTCHGGAAQAPSSDPPQQQQLRELAQRYCPDTYARHRNAPQLTRRMGERCLDEAGLGMFKGSLDRYFPPRT